MPYSGRLLAGVAVLLMVLALAAGGWLAFSFTQAQQPESRSRPIPTATQPIVLAVLSPIKATQLPRTVTPTALPSATASASALPEAPAVSATPTVTATLPALPTATDTAPPEATNPQYVFPVRGNCAPYGPYHHDYPATDIFCDIGSEFLAPTSGIIDFVNAVDRWDPATNVPADRGGIMLALIGDDGVRYYGSHLMGVADGIEVGMRVEVGQVIGWTGNSGNAASTPPHLHFGISRPTTPDDWETRRGEVPPYEYLKAWERGEMLTPVLPGATAEPAPSATPTTVPAAAPADLAAQLDPLFAQNAGTFGVIVADPASGTQRYARNATTVFPAASLIKIPIAVTIYQAANQGTINLDTELVLDASVIVGGSGSLQYEEPGSTYTVRTLVFRMLAESDNTAANMLINHLGGFAPVNQTMQQVGATQTTLQRYMMDFEARAAGLDNWTSPADMALLLQQLQNGTLPDAAGAQEIVNALTHTINRQKIPAQLPPGVVVAHKTGELPQVEHDVGIVQVPGQPYILVGMSQGLASNASGIGVIATASRVVYDATVSGP